MFNFSLSCVLTSTGTTGAGTQNHLDSSEAGHHYALSAEGDGFDHQMCPTKMVISDADLFIAWQSTLNGQYWASFCIL